MIPTPKQRKPLQTRPDQPQPGLSVVQILVCLAHNPGAPRIPHGCFAPAKGATARNYTFSYLHFFLLCPMQAKSVAGEPPSRPSHQCHQRYVLKNHCSWHRVATSASMGGDMFYLVINVFFFLKKETCGKKQSSPRSLG